MNRLFALALLALSLSLIAVDTAQAGRRRGCCCSPPAPAAAAPEAPPAPPAGTTAQADRQTVRSYSYEPDTGYRSTGSTRSYRPMGGDNYNAGRKITGL